MDHLEVAHYLADNPHFFEEHAELLGTIKLTSPLLGKAVSLQERQIEVMREKYRHLELRLAQLLRIGQENDTAFDKFKSWTNALLLARNDVDLPHILVTQLQTIFNVPQVSLRLWQVAPEYSHTWFAAPTSETIRLFASGLTQPFCGKNDDFEGATWLEGNIASLAMLPLHANDKAVGLLVLGSPDETRFTSDMATDFLSQLALTTSAALTCLLADDEL